MYKKDESAGYKHFDFLLLDWICFLFSFFSSLCIRFHENAFLALFTSEDWMKPYMRVIVLITCVHILIVLLMEPYKEVLKRDAAVEFREVCKQNVCMLICVITF